MKKATWGEKGGGSGVGDTVLSLGQERFQTASAVFTKEARL